jgi:transcriptional regulator with XRE-family HTH domain
MYLTYKPDEQKLQLLASRVRGNREKNGWTIDELAIRTRVAKKVIVQLESGKPILGESVNTHHIGHARHNIARVAIALQQDQAEWLGLANLPALSQEQLFLLSKKLPGNNLEFSPSKQDLSMIITQEDLQLALELMPRLTRPMTLQLLTELLRHRQKMDQ